MENQLPSYFRQNGVGFITLNGLGASGLLDTAGAQTLSEICAEINRRADVNTVVISGTGDRFCAGYTHDLVNLITDQGLTLLTSPAESIANLEPPTLAAVNGEASGGGLELALACDLRIASENARFGMTQILSGTLPLDGGTQRLARLVGKGKALEMALIGETIDAMTACEIGLVNKVAARGNLSSEVESLAGVIAAKAPLALRYCKEAVIKGLDLTLDQGLRLEADLYFLLHTTSDRTEGIKAFLEKRAPKYQGQ